MRKTYVVVKAPSVEFVKVKLRTKSRRTIGWGLRRWTNPILISVQLFFLSWCLLQIRFSNMGSSDKTLTAHIFLHTLLSLDHLQWRYPFFPYWRKTRSIHNVITYHDDLHLEGIPFHLRPPGRGVLRHLHRLHGRRVHHCCTTLLFCLVDSAQVQRMWPSARLTLPNGGRRLLPFSGQATGTQLWVRSQSFSTV